MKYLSILLTAMLIFACSGKTDSKSELAGNAVDSGDSVGVPQIAVDFINKNFQGLTDLKWEKEKDGFEAEFKVSGVEISVEFTTKGEWTATGKEVSINDVPENVRRSLNEKYPDYKVEEAEFITTAEKGKFYEFELENGNKEVEILIDYEGKFIKEESDEDDEADKDDDEDDD